MKGSTVASFSYRLAYEDVDDFMAEVQPMSFRRGNRIKVKLSDHTDYIFTYVNSQGDVINGISALSNRMVVIDLGAMTLTEQAEA